MKTPTGYRYSGIHSGLRTNEPGRLDLAMLVSDRPANAAGVFTQNRVCAAPVHLCRERLPRNDARGVVICSGNANACTGEQGMADARRMAALSAESLGFKPEQFLVASTGVIGRMLPMGIMEAGIPKAAKALSADATALRDAATAIMTTDTRIKTFGEDVDGLYTMSGFAKGAAMIGPNMATMLGFLFTDANVDPKDLQSILRDAVQDTFNCISVEGHTSTNDTVLIFANGTGGVLKGPPLNRFSIAVQRACSTLSRAIAEDAEGANHLVKIDVVGCRSDAEARVIAKTVAESALVKTAIYGADPNWGRIVSAAGYSGVEFDEKELSLTLGHFTLYKNGTPLEFDPKEVSKFMSETREIEMKLKFQRGEGRCTFYTCDLTTEYVRLNADYTT
jgi:glutamate N-acetyltransferase / amino-acid N-acetyltransferase